MASHIMMKVYRAGAILIILAPIVANLLLQGSWLTSLLYIPILCLSLTGLAMLVDYKLVAFFEQAEQVKASMLNTAEQNITEPKLAQKNVTRTKSAATTALANKAQSSIKNISQPA